MRAQLKLTNILLLLVFSIGEIEGCSAYRPPDIEYLDNFGACLGVDEQFYFQNSFVPYRKNQACYDNHVEPKYP